MCGIVGYVGPREASPLLLEGLKRLEYRGYDSAGIATLSNGDFTIHRSPGKLGNLVQKLAGSPSPGRTGIGHTRWATHGRPTELNAHPQTDCSGKIVVVHNGIFENFAERKAALAAAGHRFTSETDTEVFAHEVEAAFSGDLLAAVCAAVGKLTGAYAVLVSSSREPGVLVAARSGPPIVLGLGQGENFVASDPVALVPWTRDVIFLEDGDVARVDASGVRVVNAKGALLDRPVHRILWDAVAAEKGGYRHFMAKEIHEQPTAIAETLGGKVSLETGELYLDSPLLSPERVKQFDRVLLLACGTSWHAATVGKFLIEGMARIPVEVDYGSEFRYRRPVVSERTLTIGISQSGETADTVAALSEARRSGSPIAAIVNAPGQPDRAHGRRRVRDARRARDRRRLDEGLHDAARGAVPRGREAARLARAWRRSSRRRSASRSRTCPRRSAERWRSSRSSTSSPAATSTRRTSSTSAAASTTRWRSRGR